MADQPTTTPPPARRPIAELVAELLTLDVEKARVDAARSALRAELEERARQVHREEGVVPSWKAPGLGTVSWCNAEAEYVPHLTDDDRYGEWCAIHHPGNVDLVVRVSVAALHNAGMDWQTMAESIGGVPGARIDLDVAPKLLEAIAKSGRLDVDTLNGTAFLFDAEGRHVPGVGARRKDPYLSVRLNPQAKRRAVLAGIGFDPDLEEVDQ